MEEYLHKLRAKPVHHKKYFALGVSGCFTAIVFLVWSFVNFGGAGAVVAKNIPDEKVRAISPFENVGKGFANAWSSIKNQFDETSSSLDSVDLEGKYQEVRNDALNN